MAGALDAFQIRIGNKSSEIGRRNDFRDNKLCIFSLAVTTDVDASVKFDCGKPMTGRYVSIENVDPVFYSQMKLCDVDILFR